MSAAALSALDPGRAQVIAQGLDDPTEQERRAMWLAERRTVITGTDVAAIMGLSKWSSPIQVWLDKQGKSETQENEAMKWGRRLERPILMAYADTVGVPLEFADPYQLIKHPDVPLGASLDARWINDDRRPVDAKNTRQRTADWGEAGTDQIPIWYQTQLAVQMAVTGAPCADLAVLFSGQEFARFVVYRDQEVEGMILDRVAAWWKRHIIEGIEPEMDGSESSTNYLRQRFSRHTDLIKPSTPEVLALVRQRQEADAALKEAEKAKAEAENKLKAYLGEAQAIPGVLTWKNNKDGEKTNWEPLAREIALKAGISPEALAPYIAKYTTTTPGARVLRFTAAK